MCAAGKPPNRLARWWTRARSALGEYVDRGREVVDRGRAQWEEFVERGKNIVGDKTTRVAAAVEAGREAYRSAATTTDSAGVVFLRLSRFSGSGASVFDSGLCAPPSRLLG